MLKNIELNLGENKILRHAWYSNEYRDYYEDKGWLPLYKDLFKIQTIKISKIYKIDVNI